MSIFNICLVFYYSQRRFSVCEILVCDFDYRIPSSASEIMKNVFSGVSTIFLYIFECLITVCNMCERESDDADIAVRPPCGLPAVLREDHPNGRQPAPAAAALRHLPRQDPAPTTSTTTRN